ncbi:hypothetical protein OE810_09695 [Rhodobacteraceae bacterium XHP0102]|nr:hypothetical protein [Rhodobacteraceae bacterium XHP0102]
MAWRFLNETLVYMIHDQQLARFGGDGAIRNEGLVTRALAEPALRVASGGQYDAADFAGCYLYWIARSLGFRDGKSRTAWICARLFLRLNGYDLQVAPIAAYRLLREVELGDQAEADVVAWLRSRISALPSAV